MIKLQISYLLLDHSLPVHTCSKHAMGEPVNACVIVMCTDNMSNSKNSSIIKVINS